LINRIGLITAADAGKNLSALIFVIALILALTSCAAQQDTKDVDNFVIRRELCDHLRGELPDPGGDPARTNKVLAGLKENCTGTDAELKALKMRYASNPSVMKILNAFEERIE